MTYFLGVYIGGRFDGDGYLESDTVSYSKFVSARTRGEGVQKSLKM